MLWQLLIIVVGFALALFLGMQRLLHRHLISGIKHIEKIQQQTLKKEEEIHRMQAAVKKHSEKELMNLDAELASRRAAVEEEVKAMKEAAREVLETEKNALVAEIHEKERFLAERLERETATRATALALDIVMTAFSSKMLQALHSQLTDELLDELMVLEDKKISLHGRPARVRTAFHLSSTQKDTLKARVFQFVEPRERAKSPAQVEMEEQLDPTLIAGFVIYLGEKVFDGSLKNKFEQYAAGSAQRPED